MTGLTSLLATYASALIVIKIVGGAYLLWMGYKAFRGAMSVGDISAKSIAGEGRSVAGYYLRGLTVQMTNPKAVMAWIAIVSLGMQTDAPYWVGLAIIIGSGTLSIIAHCIYALAFSTATMVRAYGKVRRWIQGLLGVFFTFAGIKLLLSDN